MAKPEVKEIPVSIDGAERQIADGEYTMEQLVALLGVQAGYVLSLKHGQGKLEPMVPGVPVKVHPHMIFISQPPDGNWS